MSASFLKQRPKFTSRGFTLLELLVVVLIVGLISMTTIPQLSGLYDSVQFAMSRETFEQQINQLPYDAYKADSDLFLRASKTSPSNILEDSSIVAPGMVDATAREAHVVAPESWKISVDSPIIYRASGYCHGGKLTVSVGRFVETYILRPPLCRAEPAP